MFIYPINTQILQTLFDPNLPNCPALWAVLKGNHAGEVLVDNNQNPSQCVLRAAAALSYFGRQTSQAFLDEAITYFRKVGSVWLVWPHRTSLKPPNIEDAEVINRLEFYEYDRSSEFLYKLRRQLPDGHDIRRINAELLKRCEWREEMEYYCGSFDNFLKHGIGICMMKENEIVVEAYASSFGKTRAEIGAITREAYRGRGYAPIACAFLIETCEQLGYQAYWGCDVDHRASIRVAQKLGFRQERDYKIYEYGSLL